MKPWTFRQVHGEFVDSRRWADLALAAGGLPTTAGTRMDALERDLDALATASETKEIGRFADEPEYKAGLYSLLEARDFTRVHQAFGQAVTPGVVRRLDLAVRGPRAGTDETTANSEARNYLAELSWAALLRLSGFTVDVEPVQDVVQLLAHETLTVSHTWELKRPVSAARVEDRLKEGARQVRRAFEGEPVAGVPCIGGAVVLVMDYVLGERPVVVAESPAAAEELMRDRLLFWWKTQSRIIRKSAKKAGVTGVVLWWRPLGLVKNQHGVRIPYECTQLVFDDSFSVGQPTQVARLVVHRLRWP